MSYEQLADHTSGSEQQWTSAEYKPGVPWDTLWYIFDGQKIELPAVARVKLSGQNKITITPAPPPNEGAAIRPEGRPPASLSTELVTWLPSQMAPMIYLFESIELNHKDFLKNGAVKSVFKLLHPLTLIAKKTQWLPMSWEWPSVEGAGEPLTWSIQWQEFLPPLKIQLGHVAKAQENPNASQKSYAGKSQQDGSRVVAPGAKPPPGAFVNNTKSGWKTG